jgi:SAM-dependent methyltransferase
MRASKRFVAIVKHHIRLSLQQLFINLFRLFWDWKILPVSTDFGFSRGTPVGRSYVNDFVAEKAQALGGIILEFGEARYKDYFNYVDQYMVVDVAPGPNVDFVCDIHDVSTMPQHFFDVIVCTQVLEHLERPQEALIELRKLLKQDGRLICTVPFLAHIHYVPTDYYRFSIDAITSALSRAGFEVIDSRNSGNALVTIGSLLGYSSEDFSFSQMAESDEVYPFNILTFSRPNIDSSVES